MNSETKISLTETSILSKCSALEEAIGTLYRYFSSLYSDNDEISELFKKTASEEDSHAEQFGLACRLKGAGMKSVKSDSIKIESVLNKIKSVYETVRNSPPSIKVALELSIKLENYLYEYHMDSIVEFEEQSLEKLFISMRNNDYDHIQLLEQAYGSFNTST